YSYIDANGDPLDNEPLRPKFAGSSGEILLKKGNLIAGSNSSVLVAREDYDKVGGLDAGLARCEDWDFWIRLCDVGVFQFVDQTLVKIRRHDRNQVSDLRNILKYDLRVLRKHGCLKPSYTTPLLTRYSLRTGILSLF